MKFGRKILLLYCVVFVCSLSGCFLYRAVRYRQVAERAMEEFHADFNAGNYKKIYLESDVLFKSGRGEEVLVRKLEQTKNKFGDVKSSKVTGSSTRDHNRGTDIYLYCDTEFTNGKAKEKFTFVLIGEQVLLEGYESNF